MGYQSPSQLLLAFHFFSKKQGQQLLSSALLSPQYQFKRRPATTRAQFSRKFSGHLLEIRFRLAPTRRFSPPFRLPLPPPNLTFPFGLLSFVKTRRERLLLLSHSPAFSPRSCKTRRGEETNNDLTKRWSKREKKKKKLHLAILHKFQSSMFAFDLVQW